MNRAVGGDSLTCTKWEIDDARVIVCAHRGALHVHAVVRCPPGVTVTICFPLSIRKFGEHGIPILRQSGNLVNTPVDRLGSKPPPYGPDLHPFRFLYERAFVSHGFW